MEIQHKSDQILTWYFRFLLTSPPKGLFVCLSLHVHNYTWDLCHIFTQGGDLTMGQSSPLDGLDLDVLALSMALYVLSHCFLVYVSILKTVSH